MKDYKQVLNNFLYGGKREENFLRKLIRDSIGASMEPLLKKKIGDDYLDEVFSELRFRLILRKDHWQSLEHISLNYLKTIIKNLIIDIINGYRLEIYSLQNPVLANDEGETLTYEDRIVDERDHFSQSDSDMLFGLLVRRITERDIPVVCYYFFKSFYEGQIELAELSRSNLHKRWERLKKGLLREIFDGASPEELRVVAEKFLSEVCQKRGYINSEGVKDESGAGAS